MDRDRDGARRRVGAPAGMQSERLGVSAERIVTIRHRIAPQVTKEERTRRSHWRRLKARSHGLCRRNSIWFRLRQTFMPNNKAKDHADASIRQWNGISNIRPLGEFTRRGGIWRRRLASARRHRIEDLGSDRQSAPSPEIGRCGRNDGRHDAESWCRGRRAGACRPFARRRILRADRMPVAERAQIAPDPRTSPVRSDRSSHRGPRRAARSARPGAARACDRTDRQARQCGRRMSGGQPATIRG